MFRKMILVILGSITMTACAKKPFQPIPSPFTLWSKPEASANDVKNTMLACGFISPYTTYGMTDNAYAKAQLCMLNKGFSADPEVEIFCEKKAYQNRLPACVERQK